MKNLKKTELKAIKGGTNTLLCRKICLNAYNRCTLINGDTVQCQEAYNECIEGCYNP
jgi:hypothetical protein